MRRSDIEDLVVRRFRSSPEVEADLGRVVPERKLIRRAFPLSPEEEATYQAIADLHLDLDQEEGRRGRAIDLFRTTLAKAIFSSPAACLETLQRRLQRIDRGTARGTPKDRVRLQALADQVEAIDLGAFSKYQDFVAMVRDMEWTGRDPRDRFVIFSERIATVGWLVKQLQADLGLRDYEVGRVDGGSVEADIHTQKVLEDFGQEKSLLRILIASDMASEGLNLHFQCHRLIHFDLPWSLLRFQQRNGRIDRYGQDRPPLITYFVAESTHPKVRHMWVLEKLVEKDKAAQAGAGDPAVFLGAGDAEGEEAVVAEAVAAGIGAEDFEAQMDARAAETKDQVSLDDSFAALFGDYADFKVPEKTPVTAEASAPPRLFLDTFDYAKSMLERLAEASEGILKDRPDIDDANRLIRLTLPDDMRTTDSFGYASEGAVDDRYMPEEAVGKGGRIELTDDAKVINLAIETARMEEESWPKVQYLWDGHPILEWFADRTRTFFPDHSAPVAQLAGRLVQGEIGIVLHGAVPNANGAPVVDRWAVVVATLDGSLRLEETQDFLARVRLSDDTPNRGIDDLARAREAVSRAVDFFQTHLVELRRSRDAEIQADLDSVLERLGKFETRFRSQLSLSYGNLPEDETSLSATQKRRLTIRRAKERQIDQLFDDWTEWYERTRQMVEDPNPHVDVKAIFVG